MACNAYWLQGFPGGSGICTVVPSRVSEDIEWDMWEVGGERHTPDVEKQYMEE